MATIYCGSKSKSDQVLICQPSSNWFIPFGPYDYRSVFWQKPLGKNTSHLSSIPYWPFCGKAGGLYIRRWQGLAVAYYSGTLGVFCKSRWTLAGGPETLRLLQHWGLDNPEKVSTLFFPSYGLIVSTVTLISSGAPEVRQNHSVGRMSLRSRLRSLTTPPRMA